MMRMCEIRWTSRAEAGFTLVELLVAIVVLGILAVVAIPRFIDLSHDARAATVIHAAGVVRSAAAAVHQKAMLAGIPDDATLRQVDIGGGDLIDVRHGYPACTANGIVKATGTVNGYVWYIGTGSDLCTLYPDVRKDKSDTAIYLANCGVVYQNSNGTIWTPKTDGC